MNMGQFKDRKAVSNLLKEAILQLCRVSVGMQGDFTIDGIICIGNNDDADEEFIVKIHEKAVCAQQNATQSGGNEFPKNISTALIPVSSSANTLVNTAHNDIPLHAHTRLPFPNNNNKKQHIIDYLTGEIQMAPTLDNDVEILDIPSVSSQKQMYGDIDNFSDIECTGYDFDEMSFSDVVIKPDPGMYNKINRNSMASQKASNSGDESSDEELKIETLKAGRVRKPNKTAYTDMDGAPVQVLSAEEFKRILKSEKLKRSRDKSPDFVYGAKALRTSSDPSTVYRRPMFHRIAVKAPDKGPEESQAVNATLPQTMVSSASNMVGYRLPQHHGKQVPRTFASNMVALAPVSQLQNDVDVGVSKEVDSNLIDSQSRSSIEGDNKISIISASLRQSQMIPTQKKIPNVSLSNRSQGEMHQTISSKSVCSTSESLLKHNYTLLPRVGQQSPSGDAVNVICLDAVNKATQSKPHECPVCAGVFDTFRHLDLHMYKLHPGMFLCPVCGKSFKQRSTRNRHIVALHSSEKNFVCHICNLSFTRTDTLKKHFDASHPDVACPKKSYSYAKGMSIFSTNDQVLVSNDAPVQDDQSLNQSAASGETKHGLYADNFITPIQVTAAVENTDQVPSTVISPNASSITNITPYHTESVLESGERFQAKDNSQLKDPVVQKHMLTDDMAASTDKMKETLSGTCSSMSSDQVADSTIISLHSVTHIKPIDLTKQFGGITQQCVQRMTQQTSASVNFVRHENTDTGNINTGASALSNIFVNQKEAEENKKFGYLCNNGDTLGEQMCQSGHSNVTESTTEVNGSSGGKNDHSKIKENSVEQVQEEPNSVLGLISDGQDESNEQSADVLSAKNETDENQTSYLDTIEISDEDNTEHL